jgi:hypothetical protein
MLRERSQRRGVGGGVSGPRDPLPIAANREAFPTKELLQRDV